MKPIILVVEDEKPIRNFIRVSLETQSYKCIETSNGKTAIAMVASHNPDIIVIDLGLPDIDGIEVIKNVRPITNAAIIVVSARGREREKVEALDSGADDYLTKPFSVAELLARIRVALRHSNQGGQIIGESKSVFSVGDLKIDFDKHRVTISDNDVHLTPIEFKLISLMAKNSGRVLTHRFILNEIWGSYSGDETQSLRVFMANIRRKIEENPTNPRYIFTEVGVGYMLADE